MSLLRRNKDRSNLRGDSHWHELTVLLRHDSSFAALLLRTPPDTLPDLETVQRITRYAALAGLDELAARHLLAGLLLTPRAERTSLPAEIRDPLIGRVGGMDQDTALQGRWIRVPLATVRGGKGRLVWMLLALQPAGSGSHCLDRPEPEAGTRAAIRSALEHAAPGHGFCYWFLQQKEEQPVYGDSLALPVALAAWLLGEKKEWPRGLYATGTLDSGGNIGPVDHVREKHRAAGRECRLFLVPARGSAVIGRSPGWFACQSLDDAQFAVNLYAGGVDADSIVRCRAACCGCEDLLDDFHRLPLPFLRSETCTRLLRQAADDISACFPFLARSLWRCSHDPDRAALLAALLTPDTILSLLTDDAGTHPDPVFAAFKWCLARISLANHQGDVRASTTWAEVAEQLRPRVDPEEIGHLVTRIMVTDRFNRYDFRPEPPGEFRNALALEEKRWQIDRRSNPLLGAMYGTLAQNFGFCGPACIGRVPPHGLSNEPFFKPQWCKRAQVPQICAGVPGRYSLPMRPGTTVQRCGACERLLGRLFDAADRAEAAFDRKHWREGRRMDNYRIYGLLDAGRLDEAARLLPAYLETEEEGPRGDWFATACGLLQRGDTDGVFQAALTFRLLADSNFREAASERLQQVVPVIMAGASHPWQLIALNLGRILALSGQQTLAARLFHHAVEICEQGGATMRPMALLPLAELQAAGSASEADLRYAGRIREWLWQTDVLHRAHFQSILGLTDAPVLLQTVLRERGRLFPFSYR